jgi:hypothetical protein
MFNSNELPGHARFLGFRGHLAQYRRDRIGERRDDGRIDIDNLAGQMRDTENWGHEPIKRFCEWLNILR